MTVEWKEINPDYIISSDGRVGSRKRRRLRILKATPNDDGYPHVSIAGKTIGVHRLVAETFIGPPPSSAHQVNHKNGVRDDNRDVNLEWVTSSENKLHRYRVLMHGAPRGEAHGNAKITEAKVREIRRRRAAGERLASVAASLNVSVARVSAIATRVSWAWLA